ncbi:hypothetical protein VNO77_11165 [Canavalia gladiata]|uniref:DUF1771 domain-containing protein n=1 Tax=Canavalia gladiata TaxID=3824 RepID=A0AAN9MGK1_CANGL
MLQLYQLSEAQSLSVAGNSPLFMRLLDARSISCFACLSNFISGRGRQFVKEASFDAKCQNYGCCTFAFMRPCRYQLEVFEVARERNTIAVLDTGSALIGAYYVGGGLFASLHVMKWLGIVAELELSLVDEAISAASLHTYVPKESYIASLEVKIGYEFSAKGLLLEAMTHEHIEWRKINSQNCSPSAKLLARQAYLIGDKALAKEPSAKGQVHNMHMKAAHGKAQESIYQSFAASMKLYEFFQKSGCFRDAGQWKHERMIDLHGLHASEDIHVPKHELSVLQSTAIAAEQYLQLISK